MRSFRLPTALAFAAFAVALSAGGALAGAPTPPEQQTGSVGSYVIRDSAASTAARCVYPNTGGLKLKRIVVAAPKVRWPDTNSDLDKQAGTVGHRIVVQKSVDGGTTWTKYRASTLQKATAFEDQDAKLTARRVDIAVSGNNTLLRVFSKIVWFNKNGTTRGTIKHWYDHSRLVSDQFQEGIEQGPCYNALAS
jgi:hypothetical protein